MKRPDRIRRLESRLPRSPVLPRWYRVIADMSPEEVAELAALPEEERRRQLALRLKEYPDDAPSPPEIRAEGAARITVRGAGSADARHPNNPETKDDALTRQ